MAGYAVLAALMVTQAPSGERAVSIRITPSAKPIIIGYQDLGQRGTGGAAALDHLAVAHEGNGWWISNVSSQKRVDAPTTKYTTYYLRRWPLTTGTRIRLNGVQVEVVEATPKRIKLKGPSNTTATWEESKLTQQYPPFSGCPNSEGTGTWSIWWTKLLNSKRELNLFSLGGQVPCPRRWTLPGVPAKGAWILLRKDVDGENEYWLAPGSAEVQFTKPGTNAWHGFSDIKWQIDNPDDPIRKIVLGRTHYTVSIEQNTLVLTPDSSGDIWRAEELATRPTSRDARVVIEWKPVSLALTTFNLLKWLLNSWSKILWALGIGIASYILGTKFLRLPSGPARKMFLYSIFIATVFSSFSFMIARDALESTPPSFLLVLLGSSWFVTTLFLLIVGRLKGLAGIFWSCGLGLLLLGAIVQGQLGLGGNSARWLENAESHWKVLTIVGWIMLPLALVPAKAWQNLFTKVVDHGASRFWIVLTMLAAVGLTIQLFFGGEEGVAGVQPAEGIKTLLALLAAYVGQIYWERRAGLGQYYQNNLWGYLDISLGILFAFGFANAIFWSVRDMSPSLILALLALPILWRIAPHPLGIKPKYRFSMLRLAVLFSVTSVITMMFMIQTYPDYISKDLWPQYERLMVWARPEQYPASGFQVNMARNLAALGGDWGVDASPFGWNGRVMYLPVVQNDFIGAFVLNRAGNKVAILILVLQTIYVLTLLHISSAVFKWGEAGDFLQRSVGIFLSLSLFAEAWLFSSHSLIAWGNVLGLLPVMGQPMTFIAAGNSNLTFFALPGFILGLIASWLTLRDATT
ncbi:hypothetical protein TI04_07305 [Achromatium sp. WMS2]|nr:hypothetical protein TI04_07305 [Achromatium sp. WMS2]